MSRRLRYCGGARIRGGHADESRKPLAPAAAPSPWDIAFGTAFTTDYELRGVSQSDHKPSVQGYFELDYTATDWLKLYAGVWG